MFDFFSDFSTVADNLLLFLGLSVVILCVIPLAVTVIAGFFLIRRINTFTEADIDKMQRDFDEFQRKNPNLSRDRLIRKVIHRQAFRSGVVGAITGLGGFYTLPVMLPADILLSTRIQAQMVQFIASAHGNNASNAMEARVQTYLVTTGSVRVTESITNAVMRYAVRMLGKSFAKLIPFIGAGISFGVNYFMTQAMGNIAAQYYANPNNVARRVMSQVPPDQLSTG